MSPPPLAEAQRYSALNSVMQLKHVTEEYPVSIWDCHICTLMMPLTLTMYMFNRLYAIDTYKRHRCTWALLQLWALSNKLCILSVVRVGHLAICEVLFRSPLGAERNKHQKPCRLLIDSITKVTYWPLFLLNAYGGRHRGTGNLRLHTYEDSSEATSRCQREKLKTVHTPSKNWRSAKSKSYVLHKHLPRYKLSVQKLYQSLF